MMTSRRAAIILSGGRGTRLSGVAAPFEKTLLPVNGMPVIAYASLAVSPYVDEIGTEKWVLDEDGMLPIPNRPGLGIELDPDALTKYSRGEAFL